MGLNVCNHTLTGMGRESTTLVHIEGTNGIKDGTDGDGRKVIEEDSIPLVLTSDVDSQSHVRLDKSLNR